ncbi:MAG: hypothetical protein NVS3B26_15160 [Mycobacteriales bacterium]
MTETLLQGIHHAALAASDFDKTVAFYRETFDLTVTDLGVGDERNAFLFFDNGTFLHVIESAVALTAGHEVRRVPDNLLYSGAPLDHISLFAASTMALVEIRDRLAGTDACVSDISETGGVVQSLSLTDPDGRRLEVAAYM